MIIMNQDKTGIVNFESLSKICITENKENTIQYNITFIPINGISVV